MERYGKTYTASGGTLTSNNYWQCNSTVAATAPTTVSPAIYGGGSTGFPAGSWTYLRSLPANGTAPTAANSYATPVAFKPTVTAAYGYQAQGQSTGVCLVLVGDGSVRGVSQSITGLTWAQAMQPGDGSVLGSDWQ
jgi:hypothetical protein